MGLNTKSQPLVGSSIVGTAAVKDYSQAKRLVIVPGHAIYVGTDVAQTRDDKYWIGGFPGEAKYYVEHDLAGIDIAGNDPKCLIIFSGGQTREAAGPRSEAEGYWFLSDQFSWSNFNDLKGRALLEDFARDSFENLVFGIGAFARVTGQMPVEIIVCGWGFKEDRYRGHADTLRINPASFHYIRVNMPEGNENDVSTPLGGAMKGEMKTQADFAADPFGTYSTLRQKRLQRDPWLRGDNAYEFYKVATLFPLVPLLRRHE